MEAGKRTIRDIFNRGRNLEIPFFQRSYVWGEEQWERFLDDMRMVSSHKRPYFMGSVILKQKEVTSDKDGALEVIDGQQRLTTLNIFLKVLCLKQGRDDAFVETFTKQRDKSVILLHNHNDAASFNWVVNLKNLERPLNGDGDGILAAYRYFHTEITEVDLAGGLELYDILDKILFVGIDMQYEEDEQQIFDTINSLGVRLTTAELLKNFLFNRKEFKLYEENWKSVFERDVETKSYWDTEITTGRLKRTLIDIFFHSFLMIQVNSRGSGVKAEDKNEYGRIESLFSSYKHWMKNYGIDKEAMLKDVRRYAEIFKNAIDPDIVQSELPSESGIERINAMIFGLETTTLIPYILYVEGGVEDYEERAKLYEILESYLVRRLITRDTSKNYNQLFSDRLIYNQVRSRDEFVTYIGQSEDKINRFPSNEDMRTGFREARLVNKQSAGILYMLESKIRRNEMHSTQLLGMRNYSLEHLMPKKWENHWDGCATKEQKDDRNRILLTLGNLTIIPQSLNASIRDSAWPKKLQGEGNRRGLRHFAAGIETMALALDSDHWDESTIASRADWLSDQALKVWS